MHSPSLILTEWIWFWLYFQIMRCKKKNLCVVLPEVIIKDWSQFFFGSWRNKLKNVVHTVTRLLHKGVYHIYELFSCPKNILSDDNCLKRIKIKNFPNWDPTCDFHFKILSMENNINFLFNQNLLNTSN